MDIHFSDFRFFLLILSFAKVQYKWVKGQLSDRHNDNSLAGSDLLPNINIVIDKTANISTCLIPNYL